LLVRRLIPLTLGRGGSKSHTAGENRWTVRGFENGHPKYALHVFPGMERSQGWKSDAKRWRGRWLDVEKRCRRLDQTDFVARQDGCEQTSNDVNEEGQGSQGKGEQVETDKGGQVEPNAIG
jgi:hypothetical protein